MNEEKHPLEIFTGEELIKLATEHPELPIVFKAYCGDFTGDYDYEYASSVTARIGEILDCYQDIEECLIFSDREDFEDRIREDADFYVPSGLTQEGVDGWIETYVKEKLAEYEPYWKKCIIATVGN